MTPARKAAFGLPGAQTAARHEQRKAAWTLEAKQISDWMRNGAERHDLVAKSAEAANEIEKGLKVGDYKRCNKCGRHLPMEMFCDDNAKSGVGRYCRDCKWKPRFRRRRR